jgi:hypothetical protein
MGRPWEGSAGSGRVGARVAVAHVRGSRQVAACRRRHGSGTDVETMGMHKNEESISFGESRGVDFNRWLLKMMTGSGSSPPSGSRRPWRAGCQGILDSRLYGGQSLGLRS